MDKERKTEKIIYTASFIVRRSDLLLDFLLVKCNTSRNNVKSLLSNKQVLVNGSVVSQFNFPLAKDDEVKISKNPIRTKETEPTKKRTAKRPPRIELIYEDEDFIAIDKPAGLLAVESDNEREETAYNYVLEYLQATSKQARPFIIHRIDKETSGVLVFAKNPKVHSALRLNWNELVSAREYMAVVEGKMPEKSGKLVNYLALNQNNLVFVTNDNTKQKAITNYEVIRENKELSLLKVLIDTGRKNQIRVQLNHLGHPIVGDEKYGYNLNPLKRLGLHASYLEFKHPFTDKVLQIRAKTPGTFMSLFTDNKKQK